MNMNVTMNLVAAILWASLFVGNLFSPNFASRLTYGIATGFIVILYVGNAFSN